MADTHATEPLVTCVMNCFSSSSTLPQALLSIIEQKHKNLEIVAVNNASVDDTATVLSRFSALDERLVVMTNPRWMDPYESWRRGIQASSGEFIFLANDDDVWDSLFVSELLQLLVETEGGLAFCNVETFGTLASHRSAVRYFSAARRHHRVLEDTIAGRKARLRAIVSKNLGPTKIAPNLFYALYPAEPLRRIARRPLVWTEYGFVDERFIWAAHSYQKPWCFVDATLLRRRVGNTRPPLDQVKAGPQAATRPIPRMEVRKVIFLKRLLFAQDTRPLDRVLVVSPMLVRQAFETFVGPQVEKGRRVLHRLIRRPACADVGRHS
jgi:glycosyltransferase involved in cell wall biosynthesis